MRAAIIAASTLVLLTACASTSTLVTRHVADSSDAPVQNLLLVGRSPEAKIRKQWEKACASRLAGDRLAITGSESLWPADLMPDTETLLAEAAARGFDAVLVAEITPLLLAPLQMPPDNVVSEERRVSSDASPRSPGFQLTLGAGDKSTPPPRDQDIEFQLQRPDGTVLWNGLVRTHEANQLEAIARSQCQRVRKTLVQAGLLP
ncbi:MAG: hypothetical protein ACK4SX_07045 [Alcanivoracaceae bacterium]